WPSSSALSGLRPALISSRACRLSTRLTTARAYWRSSSADIGGTPFALSSERWRARGAATSSRRRRTRCWSISDPLVRVLAAGPALLAEQACGAGQQRLGDRAGAGGRQHAGGLLVVRHHADDAGVQALGVDHLLQGGGRLGVAVGGGDRHQHRGAVRVAGTQ